MKQFAHIFSLFTAAACLVLLVGCDSSGVIPEDGGGTVHIKMTDAPLDGVAEAHVTITRVELVGEDGDVVVLSDEEQPFDLLELQNGVEADLAEEEVEEGEYHQLRIIVEEEATLVFEDGSEETLKIPSGSQTGIKIQLPDFEIDDGTDEVEILIDFDASKSFHKAGNSGKWIFKPVIHAEHVAFNGEELEEGIWIDGEVTAVTDTSVSVAGIDFALTESTEIEEGLTLEAGAFVELEAEANDDTYTALEIEAGDEDEHAELRAPIDQIDAASLVLLDVAFDVTADTEFEGVDALTDLLEGDFVELEFTYDAETDSYTALQVDFEGDEDGASEED